MKEFLFYDMRKELVYQLLILKKSTRLFKYSSSQYSLYFLFFLCYKFNVFYSPLFHTIIPSYRLSHNKLIIVFDIFNSIIGKVYFIFFNSEFLKIQNSIWYPFKSFAIKSQNHKGSSLLCLL